MSISNGRMSGRLQEGLGRDPVRDDPTIEKDARPLGATPTLDLSPGGALLRHTREARDIGDGASLEREEQLDHHYARTPDLAPICSTANHELEGSKLVSAANAILADDLLSDARRNWSGLTTHEREGALRRAYGIYLDRTGYASLAAQPITFVDTPCGEVTVYGYFDGSAIRLNRNECVLGMEHFEEAVGTLVHEHTHALQASKTYRWLVERTNPELAAALATNDRLGYRQVGRSFEAYKRQPIEQHARSRKDLFLAAVRVRRMA